MDINKMAQFARLQREAEEEPPIPAANNHSSPVHAQLEEIFCFISFFPNEQISLYLDEPDSLCFRDYSIIGIRYFAR